MRTVIVKVGGSLLTLSDLPERLRKMFDAIAADRVMILAGGGIAADVVRRWDEIHRLSVEASHWLAIDSMGLTARLLAEVLPDSRLVADRASAHDPSLPMKTVILDPRPIIEEAFRKEGVDLPIGWHCTSDSVAAWIASRWHVDSLVLGKSVDVPTGDRLVGAEQQSDVDACFNSIVVSDLPVCWCNLRSRPESVELWKPASIQR
jgi:aspartokinase-like uncharacterized kinase